ncbi:hypothetical protein D9N00_22785 [Pseudomonas syringae pv. actinidiae]|nr:hypothetical protein D9N00_22785 [Pseudomonas syringae pv. actinidiae]
MNFPLASSWFIQKQYTTIKHAKQATQITAKLTTKKPNKKAKRVDMLDSWARLPGSFGAGNRG